MGDVSREARLNAAFVMLADTLVDDYDVVGLLDTLVHECTGVLGVQAGGILLANPQGALELVASTSERADLVEIMQLAAGAGPCIDCFTTGAAVVIDDIEASSGRWPAFRDAALAQGFRSVQATPLRLRAETIGTLNLFGTGRGALTVEDASTVRALADVATIGILQERLVRERGIVAEQLERALGSRVLIEQAKGVLSELGPMGMDEAFGVLRSYARNNNLTLRAVAEAVAARTLDPREMRQGRGPRGAA